MRLVIDSNVWVSALVFGGKPRKVFESVIRDGHVLIGSEAILDETRRILHDKFSDFSQDFEDLATILESHLLRVKPGTLEVKISRDPDDDIVLETAALGRADYIVTGDKDLLVLGQYGESKIIMPADFVNCLCLTSVRKGV
jgi:putative PIN family toxin of toxin-antitoxin system